MENEKTTYYDKQPKLLKTQPSKIKEHMQKGMTAFIVIAAGLLFFFVLLRFSNISEFFSKITNVTMPIIYGFVIAFLLNPIMKFIEINLYKALSKTIPNQKITKKVCKVFGVFGALFFGVLIIVALLNMLIPELYKSIRDLVIDLPGQIQRLTVMINELEVDNQNVHVLLKTAIEEGTEIFQNWVRNDLLDQMNEIMSGLTVGVISLVGTMFDIIVGMIISVYVLYNKDTFSRQAKKVVYAVLPAHRANLLLHITQKSNSIFGGFIIGKLIDSAIIGVLCFFGTSLLKMPYAVLVSVIVGVTNIIPYFGPFIGAIPSAILIILVDPMKGFYFIIFILALQQLDGNYIGPKILGGSTGLSSFWVIFAIMIGGGLYGFMGMLLGVPTFALILYLAKLWLNNKLEKKNLPVGSDWYDELSYVDDNGNYIHSDEHIAAREKESVRVSEEDEEENNEEGE